MTTTTNIPTVDPKRECQATVEGLVKATGLHLVITGQPEHPQTLAILNDKAAHASPDTDLARLADSVTFTMAVDAFPPTDYAERAIATPDIEVTKAVINIATNGNYTEASLSLPQSIALFEFISSVKEVVFIFSQAPIPAEWAPRPPLDRQLLAEPLLALIFMYPELKITFVDIGFLTERYEVGQKVTQEDHDREKESALQTVWAYTHAFSMGTEGEELQTAECHFLTRDEYKEKVGEEVFGLETSA